MAVTDWDVSYPAGTNAIKIVDDDLRNLKTNIQTALRANASDGTEAIFPVSVSAPQYRYRGLIGSTASRPSAGNYGLYCNTTLNTIQRDNSVSWVDVATLIPAGTKMVFFQASAPTGWTKDTTYNDYALRVTTGSGGGTGGSTAFTSAFSVTSAAGTAHTHQLESEGGTTAAQNIPSTEAIGKYISGGTSLSTTRLWRIDGTPGAQTVQILQHVTTSESAHTHTVTMTPRYLDIIICTKD